MGNAPMVVQKAEWLREQTEPLPVFIKQAPNAWEYRGLWQVVGSTEDIRRIKPEASAAGSAAGQDDVVMVIYMEPVQ